MVLCVKVGLVFCGILSLALASWQENPQLRRYVLPADLGHPVCVVISEPCTPEDYEEAKQYLREYIDEKVKQFADDELEEPHCIQTKDCDKETLEDYTKKRQEKEAEIMNMFRTVNRL